MRKQGQRDTSPLSRFNFLDLSGYTKYININIFILKNNFKAVEIG